MSAKCNKCGLPIFDEDGQCHGSQQDDGTWLCDNENVCSNSETVEFTKDAIKGYLDVSIRYWRKLRDFGNSSAPFYVDVFQSVRMSLGEMLEGP